jgi:hypothetical protein
MKKMKLFTILLAGILSMYSLTVHAHSGPAYSTSSPREGKKVPIDGGIGLLLAAGAALGARKIFNKKNTTDTNS